MCIIGLIREEASDISKETPKERKTGGKGGRERKHEGETGRASDMNKRLLGHVDCLGDAGIHGGHLSCMVPTPSQTGPLLLTSRTRNLAK